MMGSRTVTKAALALLLALGLAAPAYPAATGTPSPYVALQFFTSAGVPAAGYKLHTYLAGTSTPVTTYTDVSLSSANLNPIVLDSAGRCTIFLTPGISYKYALALASDTTPPLSPIWTRDNISAVPAGATGANVEISGVAGENLTTGQAVYLSDGTGGTTVGRWYRTDADAVASSSAAHAVGFAIADISTGASGLIRRGGTVTGLAGLSAGSLYYASATAGSITATPPTNARIVGQAESATVISIVPSLPDASPTIAGQVTAAAQTIAGVKTFGSPPVGIFERVRLTANRLSNNTVTQANVTDLSFAIAANEEVTFEIVLRVTAAAAADAAYTFTGPAAPTEVMFGVVSSSGSVAATNSATNAFASVVAAATTTTALADQHVIKGVIRNGTTAGTVQLQFAQAAAQASDFTIYAGSYMLIQRR